MPQSLLETFKNLDSNTKLTLADIDSPRLLAFLTLELAEIKFGIDRLTSEHIVACLEAAGVAVKKLSIQRALAGAIGYISQNKDGGENSYKLMTKGKREVEQILGGDKITVVRIEKNQPRSARLKLGDIFKNLSGQVKICDPYYGIRTLDILDNIPPNVKVQFLTSKTSEAGRKLEGAMKDFKKERPNIEFRLAKKEAGLHDRFVITNNLILILGHGIKDVGGKESFIIRLDKELVPDIINGSQKSFDVNWNEGTTL